MRPATVGRFVFGGMCLLQPARLVAAVGGRDHDDGRTLAVTRVLGGRLVAQGCADLLAGGRTRRPGAAVEVAHAVSMVPVAVRWPDHRRTASVSAAVALTLAWLDLRPVGSGSGG